MSFRIKPAVICVYTQLMESAYLIDTLENSYGSYGMKIIGVNADDVKNGILFNENHHTLMLGFPGGTGMNQMKGLGLTGANQVRNFVARGGYLAGYCAGAYNSATYYKYKSPHKEQQPDMNVLTPFRFFDGGGIGTIPELLEPCLPGTERKGWEYANVVPIDFINDYGVQDRASAVYIKGPYYKPAPNEEKLAVLATYSGLVDEEGQPRIAIAMKEYGDGLVTFCGVHPEMTAAHMRSQTAKAIHAGHEQRERMALTLDHDNAARDRLFTITVNQMFKTKNWQDYLKYIGSLGKPASSPSCIM